MNEQMKDELAARRAAAPDAEWSGIEDWIEQAYRLTRPGGMVALVLPDGKPFIAKKADATG